MLAESQKSDSDTDYTIFAMVQFICNVSKRKNCLCGMDAALVHRLVAKADIIFNILIRQVSYSL